MNSDINHIIARVLNEEASVSDILAFNDWINQSEGNRQEFTRLKEYWSMPVEVEHEMPEIAFERFKKYLSVNRTKKHFSINTKFLLIAAGIALLIVSSFTIYLLQRGNSSPLEYYTYFSPNGVQQLILPEGSQVYLNQGSKLVYSNRFNRENRQVTLEGEAYFAVEKSAHKFEVNVGNASIEVLGTKFNVQAYATRDRMAITLEEGSVMFKTNGQQINIIPGQQLVYDKNNLDFDLHLVDTKLFTSWKDGIYKYVSINLQELCKKLEERFDVEIVLHPKLKDVNVSGSFDAQQSLEQIFTIMQRSLAFQWKRTGNKIMIN